MTNSSKTSDSATAGVTRGGGVNEDGMMISGIYLMQCFGPDGQLKWEEEFDNLVTDQGKKFMLDNALAGTTTINSRMIIFSGGTVGATSTYALPLISEVVSGMVASGTTRLTPTWAAAAGAAGAAQTKGTSAAVVYSVVSAASATSINGAAIALIANAIGNVNVTGDLAASGVLYSAGYFTASKSVTTGDVLNVSYVTTLS